MMEDKLISGWKQQDEAVNRIMSLKTLKDIWGPVDIEENELMHDWVSVQKLKAEAIKWRNRLPSLFGEWCRESRKIKFTGKTFGEWILDKLFNLTEADEGDLK